MINIKKDYPKSWKVICDYVMKEVEATGKKLPEGLKMITDFPGIDQIVENAVTGAGRILVDILDEQCIYTYVASVNGLKWFISVNGYDPGEVGKSRKEAEQMAYKTALQILEEKLQ